MFQKCGNQCRIHVALAFSSSLNYNMSLSYRFVVLVAAIVQIIAAVEDKASINLNYQVWCQGSCDRDAVPSVTQPGIVLMGGG